MPMLLSCMSSKEGKLVTFNVAYEGEISDFLAANPDVALFRYDFLDTEDYKKFMEVREMAIEKATAGQKKKK
jgi:hypothetical protein